MSENIIKCGTVDNVISRLTSVISNKRDLLIVNLISKLGLTVSEIVNLRASQVNVSQKTIKINNRILSFSDELNEGLIEYLNNDSSSQYLFYTRQSPQITPRRVQQIFKSLSNYFGIELTPSKLRRCKIVSKLKKGESVESVKEFSGLKSINTKEFLNEADLSKLSSHLVNQRDQLLFNLFLETGIPVSRASELRLNQLNLTKGTLTYDLDKRHSQASISPKIVVKLSKFLLSRIKLYISQKNITDYIFLTRQSGQISERRIQQILKSYSQIIGREITPTILRNTYISQLLKIHSVDEVTEILAVNELNDFEYGQLSFAQSQVPKNEDGGGAV